MTTTDTNSPTPNQGELEQIIELADIYGETPDSRHSLRASIQALTQAAEARGRRKFAQKLASSNNWRVDLEAELGDTHE